MRKKIRVLFLVTFTIPSIGVYSQRYSTRLDSGWEYMKGDLGGAWEAVRSAGRGSPESVPQWTPVTLPHCFNAYDAVDPDQPYYQGPGWYRSHLPINNPFFNGRTLLHFEGAGQKTEVYVYLTKVGSHVGGYDEWTVDITEAVAQFRQTDLFKTKFNGTIPIIIRCDNSRDLEMIPSSLSDFNLYGGIYRYLNLEYVPALSIGNVSASQRVEEDGSSATLNIQAAFVNAGSV
ncbi:MAG TPA: glycoside hydrolase family 2, partial [Cyclobacteriaceae bacterium]|nr:glycoside hydrolase family 2 [Cyclobacteriaceae bacterium]